MNLVFLMIKIFFFRNISKLFSIYTSQKYIKYFSDTTRIDVWKSNGISEKNQLKQREILHQLLLIIIYYQT